MSNAKPPSLKPPPPDPAAVAAMAAAREEMLRKMPNRAEPLCSSALTDHRARVAAHRASAFIRYVPVVAGIRLRPVSLLTRERVIAFGVDLGRGNFEDLADFVWLHHPAFGQFAWFRRFLVVASLRWRLTPAWPRFGTFLVFAGKLLSWGATWRRAVFFPVRLAAWLVTFGRPCSSRERLAVAMAEARALWGRANFDWPMGDDSGAAPDPLCSFAAAILHAVKGRHPALSSAEILAWPLVELVQWWRALLAEKDPRAALLNYEEARLLALELDAALAPTASDATTISIS